MLNEIHPETEALYNHLVEMSIGEITPYSVLNDIANGNVQKFQTEDAKYHRLYAARRKARNSNFMAFRMIPNVGIKRLEDVEIVDDSMSRIDKLRRQSRMGINTIKCIEEREELPLPVKIACDATGTMLMIHNRLAFIKSRQKMESVVAEENQPLSFDEGIQVFTGNSR
jgi:hypothetical protein